MKWGAIIAFFAVVMYGCSSVNVATDYDKSINFNQYRTFDWMQQGNKRQGPPNLLNSQLTGRRIKSAIATELASKRINLNSSDPDMLVAFYTDVKDRIDVEPLGYHYGRWGWGWAPYARVDRYKEGSIIVDLIDARSKNLLWRGIATNVLRKGDTPTEVVTESMNTLFKEYPPNQDVPAGTPAPSR